MKSIHVLVALVATAASLLAAPARLRELPPEKFRAAGLHKLTEGELAELESLLAAGPPAAPVAAARQPGWLQALVTLKRTEEKPEDAVALESRIAGEFTGWSGRTLFRLENGQVWKQAGGGEYVGRTLDRPAVRIYPAAMGAYWLQVEGLRQRVRVVPHQLE